MPNVLVMGPGEAVVADAGTPTFDTISVIGASLPKKFHPMMVDSHVALSAITSKKRFGSSSCRAINLWHLTLLAR